MSSTPATFPGSRTRHGTQSGWSKHQSLGERPCDPCYQAKQEYDARRRSAPEQTRRNRAAARAQQRAYSRLAHMYPALYAALYAEEKARIAAEDTATEAAAA